MKPVLGKFGIELHIGDLVAVATNSGVYLGRIVKFNWYDMGQGDMQLGSVKVKLTTGRHQSYQYVENILNLDEAVNYAERCGL